MLVEVPHFEDGLPGGPRIRKTPIRTLCSVLRFSPFSAESGPAHGDAVSRPGLCGEEPGIGCCGRAYKAQRFYFGRGGGQMLTGNYALSDVCFNTVSRLPHQSAGKDARSCLFLTSLLNPMRSNVLRFPHGFVSSYA